MLCMCHRKDVELAPSASNAFTCAALRRKAVGKFRRNSGLIRPPARLLLKGQNEDKEEVLTRAAVTVLSLSSDMNCLVRPVFCNAAPGTSDTSCEADSCAFLTWTRGTTETGDPAKSLILP